MDIRKEPGGVARHSPDREDMVLINRLAREELTAEQVYTFSLRLCDNEIDSCLLYTSDAADEP